MAMIYLDLAVRGFLFLRGCRKSPRATAICFCRYIIERPTLLESIADEEDNREIVTAGDSCRRNSWTPEKKKKDVGASSGGSRPTEQKEVEGRAVVTRVQVHNLFTFVFLACVKEMTSPLLPPSSLLLLTTTAGTREQEQRVAREDEEPRKGCWKFDSCYKVYLWP